MTSSPKVHATEIAIIRRGRRPRFALAIPTVRYTVVLYLLVARSLPAVARFLGAAANGTLLIGVILVLVWQRMEGGLPLLALCGFGATVVFGVPALLLLKSERVQKNATRVA